eukprot:Gb_36970 [translate_table: standard]
MDMEAHLGMILASCDHSYRKACGEKNFLFDIVANGRNGIDVDKFDYIERDCRACGLSSSFQFKRLMDNMKVIDDEICFRAKEYLSVHKLFVTRADLFRTVYTHPKVKALELMLTDALVLANGYLAISSQIDNPADFWKVVWRFDELDDLVLKTIETAPDEELKEAQALILRMRRRDLYQVEKEPYQEFVIGPTRAPTEKNHLCCKDMHGTRSMKPKGKHCIEARSADGSNDGLAIWFWVLRVILVPHFVWPSFGRFLVVCCRETSSQLWLVGGGPSWPFTRFMVRAMGYLAMVFPWLIPVPFEGLQRGDFIVVFLLPFGFRLWLQFNPPSTLLSCCNSKLWSPAWPD